MKVAIYGQYYQSSTEPIIRDIFRFFTNNKVEMVIEANFLAMLYEKELVKKTYSTFSSYKELGDLIKEGPSYHPDMERHEAYKKYQAIFDELFS